MAPIRPKSSCFQCSFWTLCYDSLFGRLKCLECDLEIEERVVSSIITAFSLKKKEPSLVAVFNSIDCFSCLESGGVYFKIGTFDTYSCGLCHFVLPVSTIVDAKLMIEKTKLLEDIYNLKFGSF